MVCSLLPHNLGKEKHFFSMSQALLLNLYYNPARQALQLFWFYDEEGENTKG